MKAKDIAQDITRSKEKLSEIRCTGELEPEQIFEIRNHIAHMQELLDTEECLEDKRDE